MNFKEEILELERLDNNETYIIKIGEVPILLTAVHTMMQEKEESLKFSEPFTKAIAHYVANKTEASCFIKILDDGTDSNSKVEDEFKIRLLELIGKYDIKLVIDVHGAHKNRSFDVELGTLKGLSTDSITTQVLKDSFQKHGINNIDCDNLFTGGGITQYIYEKTKIEVVQIEINRNYRSLNNLENFEKTCDALINFIEYYAKLKHTNWHSR